MDKTVFKVTSIRGNGGHDYWIGKSYLEKIAALEQLRKVIFDTPGLKEELFLKKASGRHQDLADIENLEK